MSRVLMLLENNTYTKDVRVRQEAQSLTRAGYSVTVLCPGREARFDQEMIDGVRVYTYPPPPDGDGIIGYVLEYGYSLIMAAWFALVILLRHGFDIIHAHNPPDIYVLVAMVYKLFGKRFIFDHHDLSPELYMYARFDGDGSKTVYRVLSFFEVLSCRVADGVIATNQSYKETQMERAGIPAEKITIVRNGPDIASLPDPAPPKSNADSPLTVGYLGIIGFQDGADYLVRAVAHMVHEMERTDFRCVIAGAGDALSSIQALADELNVSENITFTGWVERGDVQNVLNSFDICVAPEPSNIYADKSTVIKMMEYMAFAKPIASFDLPEHHYSAGEAALYAAENDPAQLAAAIVRLLDDEALRVRMGQIGRQRIEEQLAWSHQEARLLELYRRLLK